MARGVLLIYEKGMRKKTIKGRAEMKTSGAINPAAAAAPQNTSVVPVAYSRLVRAERADFHLCGSCSDLPYSRHARSTRLSRQQLTLRNAKTALDCSGRFLIKCSRVGGGKARKAAEINEACACGITDLDAPF
jgi:hypothetical protein